MEAPHHKVEALFDQLGLASNKESIDGFVHKNKGMPAELEIYEAEFWTRSQAAFLEEMKNEDADWSAVIDLLDTMLRE